MAKTENQSRVMDKCESMDEALGKIYESLRCLSFVIDCKGRENRISHMTRKCDLSEAFPEQMYDNIIVQ